MTGKIPEEVGMSHKTGFRLTAVLVLALNVTAFAQGPVISSFDQNGELRCTELIPGSTCTVEWASFVDGPWTNTWDALRCVVADTNGAITVSVPMFYRVRGLPCTYLVVDLAGGPTASNYPVSYLAGVPEGGWTDDFKTSKLVLRRIPAGTFTMGSPEGEVGRESDETQHQVTLTQPFYVGVFEVTQKQWERVMGTWPSYFNNTSYRDARPVEQVSYDMIRGSTAGAGWPANSNVDSDSFMGRLRARTGKAFDLPTEAQWEYAGRAGTKTALNSGKNLTRTGSCPNMAEVGRYHYNGPQTYGDAQTVDTAGGTAEAGSYLPNAWGLYDIHGNVWEWCLDWYGAYPGTVEDPAGASEVSDRVLRGGSWYYYASICRVAFRYGSYPGYTYYLFGFRVVLPPGQQ